MSSCSRTCLRLFNTLTPREKVVLYRRLWSEPPRQTKRTENYSHVPISAGQISDEVGIGIVGNLKDSGAKVL